MEVDIKLCTSSFSVVTLPVFFAFKGHHQGACARR